MKWSVLLTTLLIFGCSRGMQQPLSGVQVGNGRTTHSNEFGAAVGGFSITRIPGAHFEEVLPASGMIETYFLLVTLSGSKGKAHGHFSFWEDQRFDTHEALGTELSRGAEKYLPVSSQFGVPGWYRETKIDGSYTASFHWLLQEGRVLKVTLTAPARSQSWIAALKDLAHSVKPIAFGSEL